MWWDTSGLKEPGFVLATSPTTGSMTLDSLLSFLGLNFLICKMGSLDPFSFKNSLL